MFVVASEVNTCLIAYNMPKFIICHFGRQKGAETVGMGTINDGRDVIVWRLASDDSYQLDHWGVRRHTMTSLRYGGSIHRLVRNKNVTKKAAPTL